MKSNRNLWPYGIIALFIVFGLGMGTLVTIAAKHPETLVSAEYYEHELQYQNQIDGAARARAAGADVLYDPTAQRAIITLPATHSSQKLAGNIELYRADCAALDRSMNLQLQADGTQAIDLAQLARGPWLLKVAWQSDGQSYYLEQKFVLPIN